MNTKTSPVVVVVVAVVVALLASCQTALASPLQTRQLPDCGTRYCKTPEPGCTSWEIGYAVCGILARGDKAARNECHFCVRINCDDIRCGKWYPGGGGSDR